MSWLWAWMMVAPASRLASASTRISCGVIGTCGFRSFVLVPLIAASMTTGVASGMSVTSRVGARGEPGDELRRELARHVVDLLGGPHRERDVRVVHGDEAVVRHPTHARHGARRAFHGL